MYLYCTMLRRREPGKHPGEAGDKPIYTADDTLVDFGTAGKIWIIRIGWGNGIDGIARAVRSHIGIGGAIVLSDTIDGW